MIYVGDKPTQSVLYGGRLDTTGMNIMQIQCTITFPKKAGMYLPVELHTGRDLEISSSNAIYQWDWGDGDPVEINCTMSPYYHHIFTAPTTMVGDSHTFIITCTGPFLTHYIGVRKHVGSGPNGFFIFTEEV